MSEVSELKMVIAGGGTGGHLYPALAIARGVKAKVPSINVLFIGTKKGLESRIIPQTEFRLQTIDIEGLNRNSMLKAVRSLLKVPQGFWRAWTILRDFAPDVVVGTGGYVSYPVVMAANLMGIKTVIHEQNAFPGLANRLLAKRADWVLLSFEEARKYLQARRVVVTGLPVRSEIMETTKKQGLEQFGFSPSVFTLVAFGGSLGAASINSAMLQVVERYIMEKVQILWITGENGYQNIKDNIAPAVWESATLSLRLLPYLQQMEYALVAADLAVCRAGAATLSELAVVGLPAILVPYPYSAENHQEKNARSLAARGAAEVIIDEFLDGDVLFKKIEELRNNPVRLKEMSAKMKAQGKPEALAQIVDIVVSCL
ncbi:MAG: undecaprenyldiphospho-muramoylpentapeptide beta-N-acetylglucosaminyltransferase, partial [Syntrophothermus sp.]|nr:undecaprenyldiphospho-muramoylpentapeptide beta-N-acetylglucosaminyltransferase [Syntrophothermus sp.]